MAADRSYKSTPRTRKGALTSFGSRTDIGCLRDHNEDSLVVTPPLFAVADGMGGHAAGEVASEIAVRVLSELAPEHPDGEALGRAIEEANRAVIQAAREGRGRQGMGTTMTAAMLEGERLVIAQVGDSRAYLLHQGKLQQLTRDHSLMADMIEAGQLTPEEARTHPQRSVITRALGSDAHLHPDIYEINVETGDRLLICSDGLSGMIFDDQIENTLRRVQDPQRCASQLVNEAIAAGGHDNVTVIVADVTGYAEVRRKKLARKTKLSIALVLVLFAALTSSIALTESAVSTFEDELGWDRTRSTILIGCIMITLGSLSALGYGPLASVTVFGMQFLDFFDFLTNSVMMPIAAIATCLLVSRIVGVEKIEEEVTREGQPFRRKPVFNFMLRYLCPIFAAIILASSVANALGWIAM